MSSELGKISEFLWLDLNVGSERHRPLKTWMISMIIRLSDLRTRSMMGKDKKQFVCSEAQLVRSSHGQTTEV